MKSFCIPVCLCLVALLLFCGCSSSPAIKRTVSEPGDTPSVEETSDDNSATYWHHDTLDEGWVGGLYMAHDQSGNELVAFVDGKPASIYEDIEAIQSDSFEWVSYSTYESWSAVNIPVEGDEDDISGYIDKTSTGGGYVITETETCRLDTKTGEVICEPAATTPAVTATSDVPPERRESVEGEGTITPTTTVTWVVATTTATLPSTTIPTTVVTTAPAQDAYSWFTEGLDLYSKGDYQGAVTAFDNSVSLDPGQKSVWYNKALALIQLGKYQDAIGSAEEAVRLDPNYANGWVALGLAESRLAKYTESAESYQKALAINPNDYTTWNNLGVVYYKSGLYQEAVDAYDHALAIKPDYTTAIQNRENALAKL